MCMCIDACVYICIYACMCVYIRVQMYVHTERHRHLFFGVWCKGSSFCGTQLKGVERTDGATPTLRYKAGPARGSCSSFNVRPSVWPPQAHGVYISHSLHCHPWGPGCSFIKGASGVSRWAHRGKCPAQACLLLPGLTWQTHVGSSFK